MQRKPLSNNFYFLAVLLIFVIGCAKAPKVVERPEPVEQTPPVTPKPVETQPVGQPTQTQLPVKRGALNITSEPMGAKVYLDDKEMDTTPMSLKNVPAGSYRVKMELEGYETWRGDVDVKHQQMAEARAKLEPKPGAIEVKSSPSGAKVQIDGKDMGATPCSKWVSPGEEHSITVSAEGYYPESRKVTLQPEGKEVVSVVLKEIPQGTLEVKSEPSGAKVWVGGKDVGVTPYSGSIVAGEEHTVIVSAEGYNFKSQKVTVQSKGKKSISVTLEKPKGLPPTKIRKDGAKMILIPAGEFIMGSPEGEGKDDEHPQHTVFLDAFYIDAYEVTVGQYKKFIQASGHRAPNWSDVSEYSPTDNHPIVYVSWEDAKAYAEWAGATLPTEAQWEKAARGGLVGKKYPWGDTITHNNANYSGTGGKDTWKYAAPVGSFPANDYGLYDMAGNVWEWCLDAYENDYYRRSPERNPVNDNFTNVKRRVLRGGSWGNDYYYVRCANRSYLVPSFRDIVIGFRCVFAED